MNIFRKTLGLRLTIASDSAAWPSKSRGSLLQESPCTVSRQGPYLGTQLPLSSERQSLYTGSSFADVETDECPCLGQFREEFVYISSFLVSQKDMFDSVMRVTGTKHEDWKISYEPSKERYERGVADLQKGDRLGFVRLLYSRVFYPDGSGDYETSKDLDNDILGLPVEDLDEYTRIAVKRTEEKV